VVKKTCHINQPYGLGDIILCEPIARYYYNKGYEVTYWVRDDYIWIKDYIPYINFKKQSDGYIDKEEVVITDEYVYLPLIRKAVSPRNVWVETGWLYDKYTISELDHSLWKTFDFVRNLEKENSLFQKLDLEGKDYILINTNSSSGKASINVESQYKIVYLDFIEGFTMLDWYKVLNNAKEIHTVPTSIVFPIVHMKHNNVTLYSREDGNDTFLSIKKVFEDYNFKYES
jgi:hypothetical protein